MLLNLCIRYVRRQFPKTPFISTNDLQSKLNTQGVVLIDCRTKEEFAVSRIPGAIHLDYNAPKTKIKHFLEDQKSKILAVPYCSVGYRSAILTNRINSQIRHRALNLEGSIFKWSKENKPLVDSKNQELEVESVGANMFSLTWFISGAVTAFLIYCNLPPEWFQPPKNATLNYLKDTQLRKLTDSLHGKKGTIVRAADLWSKSGAVIMVVRRPGCILCREEALEFMKIKPDLDALGIPLFGVVHEEKGADLFAQDFFTNTDVYFDSEKKFFGPKERRVMLTGLLNFKFMKKVFGARQKGVEGNLEGDGSLLGGTFVIGPGNVGVLYEHRETYFGDHASMEDVLSVAKSMKKAQ